MALYMYILNDCVKVGYTSNFANRKRAYNTHNPMAELIDVYEMGSEEQEKEIHDYMNQDDRLERIEKTEWYKVLDEETLTDMKRWKLAFWQCVDEDENYVLTQATYEDDELLTAAQAKRQTDIYIQEDDIYKKLRKDIISAINKAILEENYSVCVDYDEDVTYNMLSMILNILMRKEYMVDIDYNCHYINIWWGEIQ